MLGKNAALNGGTTSRSARNDCYAGHKTASGLTVHKITSLQEGDGKGWVINPSNFPRDALPLLRT